MRSTSRGNTDHSRVHTAYLSSYAVPFAIYRETMMNDTKINLRAQRLQRIGTETNMGTDYLVARVT